MSNKIIQLTSENVKRLVAVNIKPNGNLVIIGGKNAAGKSSVLDSIGYALGGKDEIPEVPIHKGAEKAKIVLELDDIIIKITARIAAIDAEKKKKSAETKYPIEGLAIAETGVITFGGLPLSQASQAEQMRISVAIAAAMNPKLRVMLIRDGSLVDEEGLALLEGLAKEFDLQIWIERVGKKDKCAVIIEDGKIELPAPEPVAPAPPQAEEFKLSSPEKSTV